MQKKKRFHFLFTNTTGSVPLCFQRLRFRQLEHGDQSHATLRHFHLFRCERKISPTFLFPCRLHCSDGFQHIFVRLSRHCSNVERTHTLLLSCQFIFRTQRDRPAVFLTLCLFRFCLIIINPSAVFLAIVQEADIFHNSSRIYSMICHVPWMEIYKGIQIPEFF